MAWISSLYNKAYFVDKNEDIHMSNHIKKNKKHVQL